jgi:hypothetical protein
VEHALQGPAQPSPALGDAINAGFGYLEVKCLGCNTHQTVALDIVRRPKATPIHELEHSMRCKDCSRLQGGPYKRPSGAFGLLQPRSITPCALDRSDDQLHFPQVLSMLPNLLFYRSVFLVSPHRFQLGKLLGFKVYVSFIEKSPTAEGHKSSAFSSIPIFFRHEYRMMRAARWPKRKFNSFKSLLPRCQSPIWLGCFGMCAEIVAKYEL